MATQNQTQSGQGNKSGNDSDRRASGQRGTQGGASGFGGMDSSEQREAARKGGETVSQDRDHMAEIGRKGGEATAQTNDSSASRRSNSESGNRSGGSGSSGGNR